MQKLVNLSSLVVEDGNVPLFFRGLEEESMEDLSWTDPALGYQGKGFWPTVDEYPSLDEGFRYGVSDTVVDGDNKKVIQRWTVEEIPQDELRELELETQVSKREKMVVTTRQANRALLQAGLLAEVQPAIDALSEPDRSMADIEWNKSQEVERNHPFVLTLGQALGLTDAELDDLFVLAATL